jgi:hypothetical protein
MVREGMRGTDQQQNHIFNYLSPEARARKDHPLRATRAMVDQVLAQLSRRFDSMYATVGRPNSKLRRYSDSKIEEILLNTRKILTDLYS